MAFSKIAVVQPYQVDYGAQTVEIILGAERKSFTIHKELLFVHAPVFRDFFTSGFSNRLASTDTIRVNHDAWDPSRYNFVVPHEDPLLFQLFRDWLYSGRVPESVARYIKAGDPCYEDAFWWRVVQLAQRLQIDRLTVLAAGELECIFSQDQATVPSAEFVASVFDEPSSELHCWRHHIVLHTAFWVEKSADRSVWFSVLDGHKAIAGELVTALLGKQNFHPQQGFPRSLCSKNCPHDLAINYETGPTEHWPTDRTIELTRARLITEDALDDSAQSEDISDTDGWNYGARYVPGCKEPPTQNWEDSSLTEEPVVATPSQSSMPPPPSVAPLPPSSQPQQSPWPFPILLEAGQHPNTQHIQNISKEIGVPVDADLIARFKDFLLSEASTHHGGKGPDNKEAAPTQKGMGNTACIAPNNECTAAAYNGGSWCSAPGPVRSGWATHHEYMNPGNHIQTPVQAFRAANAEASNGCAACGHGNPHAGHQAVAHQSQPTQQHNLAGAAWGGSIYPGPRWNSGQNRADVTHATFGDGWTRNQGWNNCVNSEDEARTGWD